MAVSGDTRDGEHVLSPLGGHPIAHRQSVKIVARQQIDPLRQGELDGLCAIYAATTLPACCFLFMAYRSHPLKAAEFTSRQPNDWLAKALCTRHSPQVSSSVGSWRSLAMLPPW